ncbi:hypothetical protein [Halorubrum kocurii]|uniref:hypothetical protein n=1 Tax=Halorubrum kocurii TaxID=478441 RepID=UPI0013761594|nr:hypothetical protein [Halorubrum kocurii]
MISIGHTSMCLRHPCIDDLVDDKNRGDFIKSSKDDVADPVLVAGLTDAISSKNLLD